MTDSTPPDLRPTHPWTLAEIVEVDRANRVQCQCNGCGQAVFKRVHLIVWEDGRIECWGSECFKRELGLGKAVGSLYGSGGGRRLTPEEREMLIHNRERLIAWFKADHQRRLLEERERAEAKRRAADEAARRTEEETRLALERVASDFAAYRPATVRLARLTDYRVRDPIYQRAKQVVENRWRAEGVDPSLPGWVGLVEREVTEEYERRLAAGER